MRCSDRDCRTDLSLVFSGADGIYVKPNSSTSRACLVAKKAGLRDNIHMLSLPEPTRIVANWLQAGDVSEVKLLGGGITW